jgi:TonB family protein
MNYLRRLGCGALVAAWVALALGAMPAAFAAGAEQGLKILNSNVVRVVYPYDLAMAGTDATVEVSYQINPEGAATGIKVIKASHPEAAAAFLASLDEMLFETAKVDGKPVLSEPQTLSVSLRQLQLAGDHSFITAIKNPAVVVVGAREVDGGLKPAGRLAPALFPSSLRGSALRQGRAVLEFYIDPAGIVRLPKVVSATDPALGWSAAAAVLTWRFAPPLKGGEPAVVKVTGLPVDFVAPPEPAPVAAGTALPKAEVYVEAQSIVNAQLKLDAEIIGPLPLRILLEVTEGGALTRQHSLSIINPNVNGVSQITLDPGSTPPARIKFLPLGNPELTGSALLKR